MSDYYGEKMCDYCEEKFGSATEGCEYCEDLILLDTPEPISTTDEWDIRELTYFAVNSLPHHLPLRVPYMAVEATARFIVSGGYSDFQSVVLGAIAAMFDGEVVVETLHGYVGHELRSCVEWSDSYIVVVFDTEDKGDGTTTPRATLASYNNVKGGYRVTLEQLMSGSHTGETVQREVHKLIVEERSGK